MVFLRSSSRTIHEVDTIFEAAFGLPNDDKKSESPSHRDRDSTSPRSNEVFKLSRAPVLLPPAGLNTQHEPAGI
jgi:hypothetical protein